MAEDPRVREGARELGAAMGGLLRRGLPLPGIPNVPGLPGGLRNPFGQASGSNQPQPDQDPDYMVKIQKSAEVTAAKGKHPRAGQPAVEEFYRVDDTRNGLVATKLDAAKLPQEVKAQAQTPMQLQRELSDANTPVALQAEATRVHNAIDLVEKGNKKFKESEFENKMAAAEQSGDPSKYRTVMREYLETALKDVDKIKDMSHDDKDNLKDHIQQDIGKLDHIQGIPMALQAVAQASSPPAPKADPLAAAPSARPDPLAPKP